MLRQEDQRAIEDLFDRLRNVERNSAPRDADAEQLIRQELQRNPAAAYYMAQTIVVQEAALREQQARLKELEGQADRGRGGFLGGIFGGDEPERREPARQPAEQRTGPWGRRDGGGVGAGGGFLAGAAQTALGVTGGMLLGSAIAGMFSTPASAEELQPSEAEDPGMDENMDDGDDFGGGDFDMGGEF